ncbi:hypothetical protein BDQ17DRAFT_1544128 [Cyathus striatus]|nr:hypothetical protein BDQ17DRAFT_1544128 [Cyathus striatus]
MPPPEFASFVHQISYDSHLTNPSCPLGLSSDMIASFPTELLHIIFKFASPISSRSKNTCSIKYVNSVEEEENFSYLEPDIEHMREDRRFPYCFAGVCKRWHDIMQDNPEWWSCIRVLMDVESPKFILSKLHYQIELTRNIQPLQIFVINRNEEVGLKPHAERDLINNIMTIIGPHMARVKRMIIKTTQGSSLPLISSGVFSKLGPLCHQLTLSCKTYPDRQSSPVPVLALPFRECNQFESLWCLALDGPTFLDFCLAPEFWKSQISQVEDISLKIAHLKTDESFTVYDFIKAIFCMKNITELTLEDIDLPDSSVDYSLQESNNGKLEQLTLTSVSPTSILQFFEVGDFDRDDLMHLELNNCNLTSTEYPSASNLTLSNITANHNLSVAFQYINPEELTIIDCPSIDDSSLDSLYKDGYRIHTLRIHGRTNITIGGLKNLIERRSKEGCHPPEPEAAECCEWEDNLSSEMPNVIQDLEISKSGYKFSNEDVKFFKRFFKSVLFNRRNDRLMCYYYDCMPYYYLF